ncbi:MAG: peptide chain release factor 2 [Gammaproteobacteria bacterium]
MNCARSLPMESACCRIFGGFFNCANKSLRITEIDRELEAPEIWRDTDALAALQRERARLDGDVGAVAALAEKIAESTGLIALAEEEKDAAMLAEIARDTAALRAQVEELNLRRLFDGEHDTGDCFLTVQGGSGGTEAQDWAGMLFRMYLRYADSKSYAAEVLEESKGEVAGLKSATAKISGPYAYGNLRAETGVHRLVRKSPFDANRRRHTSFASVFVYPLIDREISVEINPAELRIDTYRSSGAGGQHVNTTDSAVRITHLPSGIIVQCQNDRSQHKNKAQALSMLRARLYQRQRDLDSAEKQEMEKNKDDITWGSQIRSYVLDQSRIKDLRSGWESGNTRAVLNGDLDDFIRAGLLSGAGRK